MTAALPATPATTLRGNGLVTPLAKSYGLLLLAHEAGTRGWLKGKELAAEVADASINLGADLQLDPNLFTPSLVTSIRNWLEERQTELAPIRTGQLALGPDDPPTEEMLNHLRRLIQEHWQILAIVDREITGLPTADPGTTP